MAIVGNRVYNDEALGQGFSNLAALFGPPSGSDLSGYANAAAKKEEAARLAQLFQMAQNPNFDQAVFDRSNIAVGHYAPTQSFYAQDQNNATQRYGYDTQAATTISTNAADNARALATNAADNQRAVVSQLYGTPLSPGQILPALPPSISEMYALPDVPQRSGLPETPTDSQVKGGIISRLTPEQQTAVAMQGVNVVPVVDDAGNVTNVYTNESAGRTPYRPLTEAEAQGADWQKLRTAGIITDQDVADIAFGAQTPVKTVDASGKPVFMAPGAAIRTGATAYVDPTSQPTVETQSYQLPPTIDPVTGKSVPGATGSAYFDPAIKNWRDTATQQPLPQGVVTYNTQLQGGGAETGIGPTAANQTMANSQDAQITSSLNLLDVYEQLIRQNPGALGIVGLIRGTAQNAMATVNDLTGAFGKSAPEIEQAANSIKAGLSQVAPEVFDPSIPEAQFLQATLAYAIARTENPSGEVSRQAYERALGRLGGGLLSNSQEVLAQINTYRNVLKQQLSSGAVLRDPTKVRTDTNYQEPSNGLPTTPPPPPVGTVEDGHRFKGGDPRDPNNWEPV